MDKIQTINPQRIEWCCEERELTLELLAQEVKIAVSTLEQVMAGTGGLSITQLRKIAAYFNRGLLFFLEQSPVNEERIHSPQFRTLTNQKISLSPKLAAVVERMEKQRQIYISLLEELGEDINQTWYPTDLILTQYDIKKSAAAVRAWLGLTDEISFLELRQAVEDKGILVFISNGYKGKWQIPKESSVRGFSLYYPILPIIAIKKQSTDGPQAFTLMHELAHLLLHKESVLDEEEDFNSYRGKEREANKFAGNLLVPDTFLNQVDLYNFPIDNVTVCDKYLNDLCKRWSVSGETILRRLHDENLIPQNVYPAYRSWKDNLPPPKQTSGGSRYRYREPDRIFGQPFVRTVFDALDNKKITLTKASTYLDNLKIKDLRKLEETYVHI